MINRFSFGIYAICISAILISGSCKPDEAKPPTLNFKVDATHTSTDISVTPGTTITVGVICDQGDDPLKLIYSEVAYDGANVDSLYSRLEVPSGNAHYELDFTFTTRNQVGTERWTFNVNDKDGRLTEREIRIICQ